MELRNQANVFLYLTEFFRDDPSRNPYTRGTLLELHRLTIDGIFPCAGDFRDATSRIQIAGASFDPPPAYRVEAEIAELLDRLTAARANRDTMPWADKMELLAAVFHRFTVLHPFNGGNGRVGRVLLMLGFYDMAILSPPEEIFGYVARSRDRYLRELRVADAGDLFPLINFFMRGVLDTSIQATIDAFRAIAIESGNTINLTPALSRFCQPAYRARLSDDTLLRRSSELRERHFELFHTWFPRASSPDVN